MILGESHPHSYFDQIFSICCLLEFLHFRLKIPRKSKPKSVRSLQQSSMSMAVKLHSDGLLASAPVEKEGPGNRVYKPELQQESVFRNKRRNLLEKDGAFSQHMIPLPNSFALPVKFRKK